MGGDDRHEDLVEVLAGDRPTLTGRCSVRLDRQVVVDARLGATDGHVRDGGLVGSRAS
jgi:hypothetical protein